MDNKIYKVDCHCHPLDHRHYPNPAWNATLTTDCKLRVASMIDSAIERGLDAVAISDHNQFSSAMYARKLVDDQKLPIKILVSSECSVLVEGQEIHVQALDCGGSFVFDKNDSVENLINLIHAVGGLAVLNHPHYYSHLVPQVQQLMDGIEAYNGVNAANSPDTIYRAEGFKGFYTQGSDYHLRPHRTIHPAQVKACTLVEEGHPLYERVR